MLDTTLRMSEDDMEQVIAATRESRIQSRQSEVPHLKLPGSRAASRLSKGESPRSIRN